MKALLQYFLGDEKVQESCLKTAKGVFLLGFGEKTEKSFLLANLRIVVQIGQK